MTPAASPDARRGRQPHIDHDRRVRIGEPGPVDFSGSVRRVGRDEAQPRRLSAESQRNSRFRRAAERGRDARNDIGRDAGAPEIVQLLAAATEDQWITDLEPHNLLAASCGRKMIMKKRSQRT